MSLKVITRPGSDEFAPFYAGYVGLVPDERVPARLESQVIETAALFGRVSAAREGHRYEPGKWSVREVAGHMADTERVMAYRLLRIGRNDPTPLPGFDENAWVPPAEFESRRLADLVDEFRAVRNATLKLLGGLPATAFSHRGEASGRGVSVRALAYIIAGHELHHVKVLRERYGLV
ncbi:MAG TPA: DinB family protein [Gemmatimonadales bacterium]|jgi:hypothetical protein